MIKTTRKMKTIKIVDEIYVGDRLDKSLSLLIPEMSRSKIQDAIDNGYILVNGKREKASYKLELNDEIIVEEITPEEQHFEAENIPLEIVYEDEYLLVVNKPKGLVTHPGAGNLNHTLVNALKYHSKNLSSVNGEYRLGINIANVLMIPATGIFALYSPIISQYIKNNEWEKLEKSYKEVAKGLFFIGSLLLCLPIATNDGSGANFFDAFFTMNY